MSSAGVHSGNGHLPPIPETISRSSSATVVSPVVKDGVEEIVAKLVDVNDIIEGLQTADIGRTPDIRELLDEISKLQDEITDVKRTQNDRIEEIRNEVKNNTKEEVAKMLEGQIGTIIEESVDDYVKEEMAAWGNKSRLPKFITALEHVVEANSAILEDGKIQLENSSSRHANSTFDVLDDFTSTLKPIKRRDGYVSEIFPVSLKQLFSYNAATLLRLLEDYNLHALEKHAENLNRFLIFIGSRSSIQD